MTGILELEQTIEAPHEDLVVEVDPTPATIKPWEGMTYTEKLARTTSVATTTHVMIEGEPCRVQDLPRLHGFTYDQWEFRKVVNKQRTWCTIGGVALTQEEFLEKHNVELGYN